MKDRVLRGLAAGVTAVAVVAIAGCSPAASDGADGPVTLRVAGWASSEAEDQALRAQLERFTEETGIEVTFEPSPDYDTTQQTAFASGDPANVFYVDSSKLADWVQSGVVASGEGKIEDLDGIYPALVDAFTLEGTTYCPAKDFATMGLQYNKALFDAAGLAYPTADWTWEDLRAAAEQLTDPEAGVVGLVTPADMARWMAFEHQAGGQLFDESGDFALDSAESLEAIEYYSSFARDGIGATPVALDAGWGGEAFGNGRAAMAMEGGWVISYLLDTFPELQWGNTELPAGPGGEATMAFTVCYGVAADNDHPEESWQLVNFLTGEEAQKRLGDEGFGSMPSRASAAQNYIDSWTAKAEGTGFDAAGIQGFVAGADNGNRWALPPGWGTFTTEFNDGLEQVFSGTLTPEDFLSQMVELGQGLS